MRTWVLLFFCLLVLVAIANSKSNDNNDDTPKNKKGKNRKQEHGGGNVNPNEQRIKKLEQGSDSEQQGQERQEQTLKSKLKQKNNNQKQEKDCQDTCMKSDSKCKGKIITGNCPGNEVCCKTTKNKQNGIKRFCTPLDPCNRVIGECRKKKTGCAKGEKLYKSTKKVSYCSKKSCICCATPCAAKKTCTKEGGTCQSATASCDGKLKSKNAAGKKYCKGKKCACCIPTATTKSPTVTPTKSPTVATTDSPTVATTKSPTVPSTNPPTVASTNPPTALPTTVVTTNASTSAPTTVVTTNPSSVAPTTVTTKTSSVAPTTAVTTHPPTSAAPTSVTTNPSTAAPTTVGTTNPSTAAPTTVVTTHPSTAAPTTVVTTNPSTAAPTTVVTTHPSTAAPTTVATTTAACSVTRAYCPDCGVASISVVGLSATRIVNGTAASLNEYPYQVAVLVTIGTGSYQCGGSIIKKKWILTAAHCFFDGAGVQANQTGIKIAYGIINLDAATPVTALRYIIHQGYNRANNANDIALVELPTELNYAGNPSIHPICLATDADIIFGGKAVASGWGRTSFGGVTTNMLQEVALDIINTTQCQSMYLAINMALPTDTSTIVCALTPYKDTCQGDSGGPLVVRVCPTRWVQIGIVSFGYECARPTGPGVYTKVSSFRTWIDTNTGSSTTC